MDRSELEKLAERYQQKADRAFENYQDTGLRRYDTERNNMEDLADALRMAANAAGNGGNPISCRKSFDRVLDEMVCLLGTPLRSFFSTGGRSTIGRPSTGIGACTGLPGRQSRGRCWPGGGRWFRPPPGW